MQQKEQQNDSKEDSGISSMDEPELPPDGGWGWVVCFGSFVVNFILDGVMFSFGVMLLELLESFDETKSKTSMVGSALLGMSMMMGPFVSVMLEHYTIRAVTITGSIIASSGFIVSTFSPNIEILILTYGIIAGAGFCMMFIPAIIVVGYYFNRKRAFATGIAMSGSGLGTFAYAYISDSLLSMYGWRGTVLILAGIVLNCAACGAIFRPLVDRKFPKKKKTFCRCNTPSSVNSDMEYSDQRFSDGYEEKGGVINSLPSGLNSKPVFSNPDIVIYVDPHQNRKFSSAINLPSLQNEKIARGLLQPMLRKDIFYSGSIQNLPQCQNEHDLASAVASLTRGIDELSVSETSNDKQYSCRCKKLHVYLKLFTNRKFLLLLVCMVMWTAQNISLTYLPDMARSKGIPRSLCATLISIVGVANILGRVLSGLITDILHLRSINIYVCALFVGSAANFLLPFCDNYYMCAVTGGVFGLCMACSVSMRTVVIADHLGIELLTQSFGVIAMFQGVAFILNPPIAGMLFDQTQSYLYPFVMAGVMYLISGLMCLPLLRPPCSTTNHKTDKLDDIKPDSNEPLINVVKSADQSGNGVLIIK